MPESENQLIERAFQELLNTKHLYQSIEIDFEPAIRESARESYVRRRRFAPEVTESSAVQEILVRLDAMLWVFGSPMPGSARDKIFFLSLPPIKTRCSVCDDVTPLNLWNDMSAQAQVMSFNDGKQVFSLPLQCQGCRSNVIVFMVLRTGRKIQLVGRSEFEEVKVPAFIPKEHKRFYSQAVIAFNCGQILPALFLLRTLIEQHMRSVTECAEGEDLCDEYNKTLEADFKDRFPSFKDVYGKLSDALHRADPDTSLFESEIERVRFHFEGLDLFAKVKKAKR